MSTANDKPTRAFKVTGTHRPQTGAIDHDARTLQLGQPGQPGEPSAPAAAVRLPEIGDQVQGRWQWRLGEPLGRGGFGSVFLATRDPAAAGRQTGDQRDLIADPPETVAVKVFHPPEGLDPREMLLRELASMLALRCPHIPAVWDWCIEPALAMVVVSYFPAGSLIVHLAHNGPLPEPEVWRLLHDVLTALNAAHHASVLHLDIKPGNVLLDGEGGYALTDFGISQGKRVNEDIVAMGRGSPGYQAPEQLDNDRREFDARTDLYGVGVTVWTAITARRPDGDPELLSYEAGPGRMWTLPPPSRFQPEISGELEAIVMDLLLLDPDLRPGGAAEVLERVQRRLSGGPDQTGVAGAKVSEAEARMVVSELLDPVWASVCADPSGRRFMVRLRDGEALCEEAERSHHAWVLLRGRVRIEAGGRLLAHYDREGTFLGEVATLTGAARTASMRAEGEVWALLFNAAQLEDLVTRHPAVGIRMIHTLAARLARESRLRAEGK